MPTINNIKRMNFIQALSELPYIDAIYLYGSRARGDFQERSDIDLAIDCPTASDSNWLDVLSIIENADTLLKIDYVRFDEIKNPDLKKAIMNDKKIIYKRTQHG